MDMTAGECAAYDECLLSACATEIATCFGPNWEEGDFTGGACEPAFTCVEECDCEEGCSTECLADDTTCLACFFTFATCGATCDEAELCQ
jgi:hypothetical protein